MPLSKYDKLPNDRLENTLTKLISELTPDISSQPATKQESLRVFQFHRLKSIGQILDAYERRHLPLTPYIEQVKKNPSTLYEVHNSFCENHIEQIDLLKMLMSRSQAASSLALDTWEDDSDTSMPDQENTLVAFKREKRTFETAAIGSDQLDRAQHKYLKRAETP